jgi:hypothetical protein
MKMLKMSVCPELILEQEFIKTKAVEEAKVCCTGIIKKI